MKPTSDQTLVAALRILAEDIQSDDGVANAAISEAANRLEELRQKLTQLVSACSNNSGHVPKLCMYYRALDEAAECLGTQLTPYAMHTEWSEEAKAHFKEVVLNIKPSFVKKSGE